MLNYDNLRKKILGCWHGKNIGGALGAPFEGKRGIFDIDFYTEDVLKNPPPNDDLDLQLAWLNAVEKYGKFVDSKILGEYWLSYIVPDWVEYGCGKNNLKEGIIPPLSGHLDNDYKNSCGSFIRSELWACLAPGHPEIATVYAYQDAVVDHSGEGVYGEVFFAAMQSSAFVENNPNKLIEIGLSYIPEDCLTSKAVRLIQQCYKNKETWQQAREKLMKEVPGGFGIQFQTYDNIDPSYPIAEPGMDAPNNIGLAILGWLYGEGDFGKSICLAVNCGEDTDCTAASIGALMGIIGGVESIPEKWQAPINGVIKTCCLDLSDYLSVPKTVDELTDRIMAQIPGFINFYNWSEHFCELSANGGYVVHPSQNLKMLPLNVAVPHMGYDKGSICPTIAELIKMGPYKVLYRFPMFFAVLDYGDNNIIKIGEKKTLTLSISGNMISRKQRRFKVSLYGSEGVEFYWGNSFSSVLQGKYKDTADFILPFELTSCSLDRVEIVMEISVKGRHTSELVKAIYFVRP